MQGEGEPLQPALDVFAPGRDRVVQDSVPHGPGGPERHPPPCGQVDAVVLAGGDGTLHEAAEALVELGRPVAYCRAAPPTTSPAG
jgi:hypothetical protein